MMDLRPGFSYCCNLGFCIMRRVVSCFLLFFLIGCSDTTPDNEASFGAEDWAIQESQLQLEEDLYITEMEDYFFGAIADVAADEEGRIYVADARELHVKVLSPEGELLHTVGRQGEAPGELVRLASFTWRTMIRSMSLAHSPSACRFSHLRTTIGMCGPFQYPTRKVMREIPGCLRVMGSSLVLSSGRVP